MHVLLDVYTEKILLRNLFTHILTLPFHLQISTASLTMTCRLHPTTKFCLFCLVISTSFHVHLCHKYGDLSHDDRHVNDTNPRLHPPSSTQMPGESSTRLEHGPDPNYSEGNKPASRQDTGEREGGGDGLGSDGHISPEHEDYYSSDDGNVTRKNLTESGVHEPHAHADLIHDKTEDRLFHVGANNDTGGHPGKPKMHKHRQYLWAIFNKYGHDGVMTHADLEKLMAHIGLGALVNQSGDVVPDHDPGEPAESSSSSPHTHRAKRSHHSFSPPGKEMNGSNQLAASWASHVVVRRDVTGSDRKGLRHHRPRIGDDPLDKVATPSYNQSTVK